MHIRHNFLITLSSLLGLLLCSLPGAAQNGSSLQAEPVVIGGQPVYKMASLASGQLTVMGHRDGTLTAWDAADSRVRYQIPAHESGITALATDDNSIIATGSQDGHVRLWRSADGSSLYNLPVRQAAIGFITFSVDGRFVLVGAADTVIAYAVGNGTALWEWSSDNSQLRQALFGDDGNQLIIAADDGNLTVWTGWSIGTVDEPFVVSTGRQPVLGALASPDGRLLVTRHTDLTLRLWDMPSLILSTAKPISQIDTHGFVTDIAFLDDTTLLATLLDGTLTRITLGNIESDDGTEPVIENVFTSPALSPLLTLIVDDYRAWLSSSDGRISIWSAVSGQLQTVAETNIISNDTGLSVPAVSLVPRLTIPHLGVSSDLIDFTIADGTWQIDPWEPHVGQLEALPDINGTGNIVLAGHSEYPDGKPGVFHNIETLWPGDVIVTQEQQTRTFVVAYQRSVVETDLTILYPTLHNQMTLFTCSIASYVASTARYEKRSVVVAIEITATGQ